jgi:signal transduction histidine kinase
LRPYQIDRLGLTKAIESILKRVSQPSGLTFASNIDNIDNLFSKQSEINIYRIVQECVNNVMKHSAASSASVSTQREEHHVMLIVDDNGRGFESNLSAEKVSDPAGFGLRGISERVKILRGTFSVHSTPGSGTRLTIRIPIPEDGQ